MDRALKEPYPALLQVARLFLFFTPWLVLAGGCAQIGPGTIDRAKYNYNQAILDSSNNELPATIQKLQREQSFQVLTERIKDRFKVCLCMKTDGNEAAAKADARFRELLAPNPTGTVYRLEAGAGQRIHQGPAPRRVVLHSRYEAFTKQSLALITALVFLQLSNAQGKTPLRTISAGL